MRVNGRDGSCVSASLTPACDGLELELSFPRQPAGEEGTVAVLEEHGLNLLIEGLRSAAEDLARHREGLEMLRLAGEGKL